MDKENLMYKYLIEHNYVSFDKQCDKQKELSVERAECIASKYNSLVDDIQSKIEQLNDFKQEHFVMKQILIENGLWETLLNDDRFIEHLKSKK